METGASRARGILWIALVSGLGLALFLVLRTKRADHRGRGSERSLAALGESARPGAEPGDAEQVRPSTTAGEREAVGPATEGERDARDMRGMRVLVRDAVDERPLEGARATLFDCATPVPSRSGRDGVCLVPVLSFEERSLLRVEALDHFHWSQELVPRPNLAVELQRSVALSGRVLAADTGASVAGAALALPHEACAGCEPERVLSAPDGSYEFSSVPLRSAAVLEIRAEGFAPARRVFELRTEERRVEQDIRLVRGLGLAGRVEDWTTRRGIPGAQVGELVADEQGRYQGRILAQPVTGRTGFDVRAPGYATLRVALAAPPAEDLVFRLPLLAFLEGRVSDSRGQPLADTRVSFEAAGPDPEAEPPETSPLYELPAGWAYATDAALARSRDDGQYRLAVLPWSLNGTVRVNLRGFAPDEAQLRSIGEPDSKRRLDWWLRTDDAPPVVNGQVTLDGQACEAFQGTVTWRGPTRAGAERLQRGGFRFVVEAGEVRLSAVLDRLPRHSSNEVAVRFVQGEERNLDLDVVVPIATITGSVRFVDDTPVPGRDVLASCPLPANTPRPAALHYRAVTDEEGEFALHVPDAELFFDVSTTDFEGTPLVRTSVAAGASGADFVLGRGYRLFLRAREARTGAALVLGEDVQFLARGEPRYGFRSLSPVGSVPDVDGWYECCIAERAADLLALPRAAELPLYGARLLRGARLDGPTPARLEFVLERGLDVSLELAEGVPPWPADHELFLLDEVLWDTLYATRRQRRWSSSFDELHAQCSVHFDAQGRAHLRGLAPGSYRFKPLPADLVVDPEFVQVDSGTLPVRVHWSRRE